VTEDTHELPARFGPFYLFDLIGTGGMAEIFLSKTFTSLGTDRLCVIKRILPHFNADQSFCEMLIKEAKLCSHLSHAKVVQTFDLGQIDDQYYIAMEYVEGFDLNQLLGLLSRARIALPLTFALYIVVEVLRGLGYAHRLRGPDRKPLGIIHCDVSPTNVLISTDGDVKLCDFGIAKAALGDMQDNQLDEYHLKGKLAYMAPEHVRGQEIDHRADLFAAGILLWELLSGQRLYKTKDEDETLRRAREAEIRPLTDRGFPNFGELEALVTTALRQEPADRFQSGQEFVDALEEYMHKAGLIVSQLKLAEFLTANFGEDLMRQRRERERNLGVSIERLSVPAPCETLTVETTIDEAQKRREADITAALLLPEDEEDYDRLSTIPPSVPPPPAESDAAARAPAHAPLPAAAATGADEPSRRPAEPAWIWAFWVVAAAAVAGLGYLILLYD
jgi:serine/threonine-protein kinase